MFVQTYRNKIRLAAALAVIAAIGAGLVGGRIVRLDAPGEHFWLVYPALLVVCALAFVAMLPWWRKIDDMQRTGHLVSWHWGGLAGTLAVMMALVAATGTRSDLSLGSLYTLLGQAGGYFVFLAVWRLQRRGPTA
jgi:hypothetical protein